MRSCPDIPGSWPQTISCIHHKIAAGPAPISCHASSVLGTVNEEEGAVSTGHACQHVCVPDATAMERSCANKSVPSILPTVLPGVGAAPSHLNSASTAPMKSPTEPHHPAAARRQAGTDGGHIAVSHARNNPSLQHFSQPLPSRLLPSSADCKDHCTKAVTKALVADASAAATAGLGMSAVLLPLQTEGLQKRACGAATAALPRLQQLPESSIAGASLDCRVEAEACNSAGTSEKDDNLAPLISSSLCRSDAHV